MCWKTAVVSNSNSTGVSRFGTRSLDHFCYVSLIIILDLIQGYHHMSLKMDIE